MIKHVLRDGGLINLVIEGVMGRRADQKRCRREMR